MGVNGIYGLSGSGLDIESMVKVGMMSKQNEYDKMAQKFTKNEWTKTALLDVYSTVNTFNTSTLSQYKMSANMNAKDAESSNSAVKVTANASAAIMSHRVDVNELSSNAYMVGTHSFTRYNTDNGTVSSGTSLALKDVLFSNLSVTDDGYVSGNIANVTANSNTESNNSGTPNLSNNYGFGKDSATTPNNSVSLTDVAFSFKISDGKSEHEISYTYKDLVGTSDTSPVTFNDLVSKINNLDSNIKASYDSVNDKFSFYNKEGGEENKISITLGNDTGISSARSALVARNFFDNMGLYQSKNGQLYGSDTTTPASQGDTNSLLFSLGGATDVSGSNGKITVDGVEYTTKDNSISVGGITYNALEKTSSPATVTVTQDTDAIVDKVKKFVEDYNKLLSGLYEKYDEKPNKDYKPLTQAQKDQMKDEQIDKWEEKAKAGLLYHDQTLGKIIDELRSAISTPVESIDGKFNSAYSIGISTTGLKGQLVLDETKLKNALAENSDAVYNVFAKLDESKTDSSGKTVNNPDGNGIAQRIGDILVSSAKTIRSRAGSSADITEDSDLNNLLRELQTKMSNFKKLMSSFEDKLYKKYDAMEVTLAKLGAQLNFVMGGNQ